MFDIYNSCEKDIITVKICGAKAAQSDSNLE